VKKIFLGIIIIILSINCDAAKVFSCYGEYLANDRAHRILVVRQKGKIIGSLRIEHAVNGGVFSLDNSTLIVFGVPLRVDVRAPQVTWLSIVSLKPKVSVIRKEVFGGGVYEAAFSSRKEFIVVNNQFGIEIINIKNGVSKSFDATYIPPFSMQECKK
jgi:hypothetical protein